MSTTHNHQNKSIYSFEIPTFSKALSIQQKKNNDNILLSFLHRKREFDQHILKQIFHNHTQSQKIPIKPTTHQPLPKLTDSEKKHIPQLMKKENPSHTSPASKVHSIIKLTKTTQKKIIHKPPSRSNTNTLCSNKFYSSEALFNHEFFSENTYLKSVPKNRKKSVLSHNSLTTNLLKFNNKTNLSELLTAHTINDFKMVAPIGAGCFGAVHLAKNHMNKPVAIKVVSKDFAIKMNQQTHLLSEKKLMMNLNSTYTLKWYIFDISYETFQDADNIYFVNEYVPGGTVGNAIKRLKYSIEAITFYTAEIIIALGFLHNKKIIYRDLKSDNILIDSTGHVKLIDFGLGKEMDSLYTTTICGTPAYISPEQLEGKKYTYSSDIWSLGVVIFELFATRNPFYESEPNLMWENIKSCSINWCPNMPYLLKDLISSILVLEPTKRLSLDAIKKHDLFSVTFSLENTLG